MPRNISRLICGVMLLCGSGIAATLQITPTSLPDARVGTAYSATLSASGGTAPYTWSISSGALPGNVALTASGTISGTPSAAGTFTFTVAVTDSAQDTGSQALQIVVDPPLAITTSSLPSGTVGTSYSQTLAATGGSGGYTWSVTSGTLPAGLALAASGSITGTPTTAGTANFTVTVTDSDSRTVSQGLGITINPQPLTITTSSLPGGTVGASYSQTLAATGGSGGYTWSLTSGALPAGLALSASSGAITGTPTTAGTSNFAVTVTDSGGRTASSTLGIAITLLPLTVTTSSLPGGTVGTSYSQTLAATGGSGGYTWSVTSGTLPAGLALSASGSITGTPTTAGTASFTVTVTDSGNRTASQPLGITTLTPLTITTSSLPNGTVGTSYSQTLAATGGSGGYTWSVTSCALPAGLALGASGSIAGTPTTAAPSSFTATVTDSGNRTASKALAITINPPPVTITTSSLPNGTVGTSYLQTLAATGGTGAYTWSVTTGALPAGLALASGGTISGTPSAPGTASFTVQVKDSGGNSTTKAFTLTVATPPLTITTASLPGAEQSVTYAQSLAATGGTGAYTWSVTSGALPTGLSMDQTGRISGTVTGATASFTVQVSDSVGVVAAKTFSITVTPAPAFSNTTLAAGIIGGSYSVTITVNGGQAPYTFGVMSGQLPPGLTLNQGTGQISGTPGQVGSFSFVLQVRDAGGGQGQGTFLIVIGNALTITTAPVLPGASLSVAYQVTLAAAGGQSPYTWSATAGALPAGLTFSPNGQISGKPTAAGSFQFTAAVTDATGGQATKAFTLAVASALTISTAPQLPSATVGVSYTGTLTASGGTPPYTWSVSVGAVPPGVTFAAGTLAGMPSSAGTYNFTAVVTDSANVTAQKAFTLAVAQGVQFTTPTQLPDATAGTPYSFTLQAAGGSPPYSWQLTAGALPGGLSLNASSGVISGTPSAAGTFNFTILVTDSTNLTASRVQTLVTDLPSLPALSVAGIPATMAALQQLPVDLTVAAPFPVAVTGQLNLTFVPASGMPDDPAVQFSSGGRSVNFTLAANATHASFGSALAMQAGSVEGTIQFTVASLTAGTTALHGPTAPVFTTQVAAGPPVINSVTVTPGTNSFTVQVVGLSTTRDLVSATVQFTPTAGTTLQTTQANISLSAAAGTWFQSSQSSAYGGQFTLTLPFSVVGGTAPLNSVSVVLTNSVGSSTASSTSY
jgi:large repetitive protein